MALHEQCVETLFFTVVLCYNQELFLNHLASMRLISICRSMFRLEMHFSYDKSLSRKSGHRCGRDVCVCMYVCVCGEIMV